MKELFFLGRPPHQNHHDYPVSSPSYFCDDSQRAVKTEKTSPQSHPLSWTHQISGNTLLQQKQNLREKSVEWFYTQICTMNAVLLCLISVKLGGQERKGHNYSNAEKRVFRKAWPWVKGHCELLLSSFKRPNRPLYTSINTFLGLLKHLAFSLRIQQVNIWLQLAQQKVERPKESTTLMCRISKVPIALCHPQLPLKRLPIHLGISFLHTHSLIYFRN